MPPSPTRDAVAPRTLDPPLRPAGARRALAMLALFAFAGCADWPGAIRLPGGPTRGSLTYDEAMGARSGLTTLDRIPAPEPVTSR
jgi:hypothetical protein